MILAALFYMFSVMSAMNQQQMYKVELSQYDLNQDGVFTDDEINPQMIEVQKKVTNDTAKIFAPYTLIPISILMGILLFSCLFLYQKYFLKKNRIG